MKRTAVDYDRMRCYVRLFDPDVLAVQEVDGEEALSRVEISRSMTYTSMPARKGH